VNSFGEAVVSFVPAVIAAGISATTGATPLEYGVVGIVLIGGMFPVVRWMMRRMDFSQKENAASAKRREEREERHIKHLSDMVTELRVLTQHHVIGDAKRAAEHCDVMDRLENLERVVRKEQQNDAD